MIVCINYADKKFIKQQKFNTISAKLFGGFDKVISYSPSDIDNNFQTTHQHILNQPRGGGYWLWKPYLILKTLEQLEDGDFLFYSDSGVIFLKSVHPLIKEFEKLKQPILGFQIPLIEKQWTKEETFLALKTEDKNYKDSPQICASYIFMKKTTLAIDFIKEYLFFCVNEIALTDKVFATANNNYFIDHRHDQSIFSLLYKKYGFEPLGDLSNYGVFPEAYCQPENRQLPDTLKFPKYAGTVLSIRGVNPILYTLKYFSKRWMKKFFPQHYKNRFNKRGVEFNYN